jgi:hypothetical protein
VRLSELEQEIQMTCLFFLFFFARVVLAWGHEQPVERGDGQTEALLDGGYAARQRRHARVRNVSQANVLEATHSLTLSSYLSTCACLAWLDGNNTAQERHLVRAATLRAGLGRADAVEGGRGVGAGQ